ncbi:MAG: glycosyltransferase family 4 protein [Planctomycetota bacterium]
MRICLICNQVAAWGKVGGFGTNTRRLGRALAAAGVDVHVVVPRRRGQRRVEHLDGMIVHGQSWREVLFGTGLYRDIDADVYHAEEPTICAYHAQQAMPNRVHLVTSMDPRGPADWWIELCHATWTRRIKFPVQYWYENSWLVRRSVQSAHGVHVEAEFLKEKAARHYGLKTMPGLLPKPVEIPSGPFKKADRPLCVFLGRFDPRKRPSLFFQLAEQMPDVDFIAMGRAHDGNYERHLARRYFHLPNVEVTGFIDPFQDHTFHNILSRAWVLVHPAAREGLPTAFQEASAREMAILAYVDPGGYVSRFGDVVTDDGSIGTLATALREMLGSGRWRDKARAGRQWNITHHSVSVSVATHMSEYEHQLLNLGRAASGCA